MNEVTADIMDGILAQQPLAAIKFYANWCGPCKMLKPVFERVAETNLDVAFGEINADTQPGLLAKYGVQGLPTVIIFKDGHEAERIVGMKQMATYQEALDKHKSSVSDDQTE